MPGLRLADPQLELNHRRLIDQPMVNRRQLMVSQRQLMGNRTRYRGGEN